MRKYEAMFILKPDLAEDARKGVFSQISETITKNKGGVQEAGVWSEKRKLCFSIARSQEGLYYLMKFNLSEPAAISELKRAYRLNENILRVLITKIN